ncbi:calcium/sodium antiporter [Desulfitibacter alkalitolerans]|uniref:calcium/sodium antiporter n=1 Tax=Desulfitibacter alkalitolerans TaxID=264641 RepID=UPI000487B6A8|nr:calcium/sodium antiporter [Desulfitibacter alkalitolerans]
MAYFLLLLGFVLLIKGADFFIDGAAGIAKALKLPPMIIGLTIVAFGTSSPEAAVSISAAIKGSSGISLGNVIGSNIFNISFVIGIMALLSPLKVEKQTTRKEIPFALLSSILLLILVLDRFLQQTKSDVITRGDGLVFLIFFSIFIYYLFEMALKNSNNNHEIIENPGYDKSGKIFYLIIGLTGIILGGKLVVDSSVIIALNWGLSQSLVGLTIVAVGTSLPELVTSIAAVLKKENEIAIGNLIGSNIFNILFILGTASVISPIHVEPLLIKDTFLMIFYTIFLFIFAMSHYRISRKEGFILLMSYLVYLAFIISR